MENIQNKSALIPSDEIRSEELLAEQIWYESAGRG